MVEALFFDEGPIFQMVPNRSAAPSLTNFVGQLLPLTRHRYREVGLDFLSSMGCTGAEWHKGGHAQVTLTKDRAPRVQKGNEG